MILIGLFACLVQVLALAKGQNDSAIQTIGIDTCMLQRGTNFGGTVKRVSAPKESGGEGLEVSRDGYIIVHVNVSKTKEAYALKKKPIAFGYKFLVDLGPKPDEDLLIIDFAERMYMEHTTDDKIRAAYEVIDENNQKRYKELVFDQEAGCIEPYSPTDDDPENADEGNQVNKSFDNDDSGWVNLIGKKVPISEDTQQRRKRSTDSKVNNGTSADCWKIFGIEFYFHGDYATLEFYMNGVQVLYIDMASNQKEQMYFMRHPPKSDILLENKKFSCLEFTEVDQDEELYYGDYNLEECKKKYQGRTHQSFEDCEKNLS